VTTLFESDASKLGFGYADPHMPRGVLTFQGSSKPGWYGWRAESYVGSGGYHNLGFVVERDQNGNNILTGQ
jgi:hypothetical protein